VAGFSKNGNEYSGSIKKTGNFLISWETTFCRDLYHVKLVNKEI
jgi:hypothetical protein